MSNWRQRYQALFDDAPVALFRTLPSGEIVAVNKALLSLYGYDSPDQVIGKFSHNLYANPADRERMRAILERTGWVRGIEVNIRRADGSEAWVLGSVKAIRDETDQSIHYEGSLLDITDRKRAVEEIAAREERFRAMIERSSEAIALINSEGKFLYHSPAAANVLGVSPDGLVGASFAESIHPDDLERARSVIMNLVNAPGESVRDEIRFRHGDGTWHWMEATMTNLLNEPNVRAIVSNYRDVTDRRHAEEALRQSQKLEAVGRLAGGVAHDFNNLLTVILGEVELLQTDSTTPGHVRTGLREVYLAAERAARLTKQLLLFSRKQNSEPRVLDVNEVVSGMTRMFRRLIGETISLRSRLQPVPKVRIDQGQLEQVLANLIVNARDAMPDGGDVFIETRRTSTFVVVSVRDTGTGMSEETREQIFEPFFTTKPHGAGTGLGLSTVFGIITRAGGRIEVESELGKGTTMSVCLPIVEEAGQAAPPPQPLPIVRSDFTVLVVEREAAVRTVVERHLRRRGFLVLTTGDPDEATHIAREHKIDVLLSDTEVPAMPGNIKFCRLEKPFTAEELVRSIQNIMPRK